MPSASVARASRKDTQNTIQTQTESATISAATIEILFLDRPTAHSATEEVKRK